MLRIRLVVIAIVLIIAISAIAGCGRSDDSTSSEEKMKIVFLHHSTGKVVWDGGVKKWLKNYNKQNRTDYKIKERTFPAESPYGWNNYPYDYWNIWVNNAGQKEYQREPTLEILTPEYDLIAFKHCFPVSGIQADIGQPDITSPEKRIENYKLQYNALKQKMREFRDTKFLVWTGAALVRERTNEEEARRAREFADWVINEWDEPGDNIFVWDFYGLETEGGLYLSDKYANGPRDSHPNKTFSKIAVPSFGERIVEVLEGRSDGSIKADDDRPTS